MFPNKPMFAEDLTDVFPKNLLLLHKECHKQVTNSKNENTIAIWRQQGIIK